MFTWYVVHTLSGSENKVKEMILDQVNKCGMQEFFLDIVIPIAEINEMKKGKLLKIEKKMMPSYIFIKMQMTDSSWHLIKSIPKITGFLGSKNVPKALTDEEVQSLFKQFESKAKDINLSKIYEIGDTVTIIDGPFDSFNGIIDEVDSEGQRIKVSVSIFGKFTRLDLSFEQVKKVTS